MRFLLGGESGDLFSRVVSIWVMIRALLIWSIMSHRFESSESGVTEDVMLESSGMQLSRS